RPYQGNKAALRFIQRHLGTPRLTPAGHEAVPELRYGDWCDRYGVALEQLYGVELHYRGAVLPDMDQQAVARERLAVLVSEEAGGADFTIEGWLAAQG